MPDTPNLIGLVNVVPSRRRALGDQYNLFVPRVSGFHSFLTGRACDLGTAKHVHAKRMLDHYQGMYGKRGLSTEVRYINQTVFQPGTGMSTNGSVILDVVEGSLTNPTAVYDYKFGKAGLTNSRINKIRNVSGIGNAVPINPVRP